MEKHFQIGPELMERLRDHPNEKTRELVTVMLDSQTGVDMLINGVMIMQRFGMHLTCADISDDNKACLLDFDHVLEDKASITLEFSPDHCEISGWLLLNAES